MKIRKKSQSDEGIRARFSLAGEQEDAWGGPSSCRNLSVSVWLCLVVIDFSCMQHDQGVGNAKAVGLQVRSLGDGAWLAMWSLVNLGHSMRMCALVSRLSIHIVSLFFEASTELIRGHPVIQC